MNPDGKTKFTFLAKWRASWIRKDREQYFASGLIVSALIASYVAAYWHAADRINMFKRMKIKTVESADRKKERLQDSGFIPARKKAMEKYYNMEPGKGSAVPSLEESGDPEPESQ